MTEIHIELKPAKTDITINREHDASGVTVNKGVRVPEVATYLKSKTKYSGADDLTSVLKGIIDYCGKCDRDTDPVSPPEPISPPKPTEDDMTVEPIFSEPKERVPDTEPVYGIDFTVEQEPSDVGQIRLKITADFDWSVDNGFSAELTLDPDGINLRKELHFKPNQTGAYVTIKWERDGGFNGEIRAKHPYDGSHEFNFIVEPMMVEPS